MRVFITLLSLMCIVSCGEADLNELKLDYSSIEANETCLIDITSKLNKDQYYKLMKVVSSVKNEVATRCLKTGKEYSQEEWDRIIFEGTKKALHGKSVAELIGQ